MSKESRPGPGIIDDVSLFACQPSASESTMSPWTHGWAPESSTTPVSIYLSYVRVGVDHMSMDSRPGPGIIDAVSLFACQPSASESTMSP